MHLSLAGCTMKIIYTRKGEEILVDDEDYDRLNKYTWHINSNGYAVRGVPIPGKKRASTTSAMHREVMGLSKGDPRLVDHRFGIKTDNRKSELRICTNQQNLWNRKAYPHGASGLKGVTCRPKRKKWEAYITLNGKKTFLGVFNTAEEAHEAYCRAAPLFHGEFANTENRSQEISQAAIIAPLVKAALGE